MTTSTTKKEVDINSRNLQISIVVDTWNKLKPRILYFSFCYPISFISLPWFIWVLQKNIICHILTSLMFILIHSSFTKSLMLFFSSPFIFAYYSILLIAFASPIFLLHLSSRDRVPYIYRFQNPPPPLFQVWSLWKSLCLLFQSGFLRLSDLASHVKNTSNSLLQDVNLEQVKTTSGSKSLQPSTSWEMPTSTTTKLD